MTDRYKHIREALEMGPTPGPWCVYGDDYDAPYVTAGHNGRTICLLYEDFTQFDSYVTLGSCLEALRNAKANAYFIAACNPDTIRKLLAESDELLEALEDLVSLAEEVTREVGEYDIEAELADAKAAIAKARGRGEP